MDYPTGPNEILLQRSLRPEISNILAEMSDLLDRIIDFGTHVVVWVGPATAGADSSLTPVLMLLHHALEAADSISILLRQGCADTAVAQLRSQMEATLSLLYILEDDTNRRGLAYRFSQLKRQAQDLERLDPSTPRGIEAARAVAADKTLGDLEYDGDPKQLAARRAEVESFLNQHIYSEIRTAWSTAKKREPAWHSLFSGPSSMADLAERLGLGGWYMFYRAFSEEVHSSTAMKSIRGNPKSRKAEFRPFRYPEHSPQCFSLCVSFLLIIYREVLERFAKDRVPLMAKWYVESIQADYDRLRHIVFKEPPRQENA